MEYALWAIMDALFRNLRTSLNPCFNGICSLRTALWMTWIPVMSVLILVLMEYALWVVFPFYDNVDVTIVLILVLMEYALWVLPRTLKPMGNLTVLILVLMEYALWANTSPRYIWYAGSLNPCFNGICSLSERMSERAEVQAVGLNPCFNGICSLSSGF